MRSVLCDFGVKKLQEAVVLAVLARNMFYKDSIVLGAASLF
jgi:hypothetical protein